MVSGVVRDTKGRAMTGATLARIVTGGEHQPGGLSDVVATAQTDEDGKYGASLGSVPIMGNYAIYAMAAGYCPAATQVLPADLGGESMAPGKPGKASTATKVEEDFVLNSADRVVRGVVKDRQGQPLAGAVVTANPMGDRALPLCAVTDANGRFFLDHIGSVGAISLL